MELYFFCQQRKNGLVKITMVLFVIKIDSFLKRNQFL